MTTPKKCRNELFQCIFWFTVICIYPQDMVQNMLEHLKCVLVEYKMLIIKMSQDNIVIVQARLNLDFF
jgi:hypothetical protein